MNRLIMLRAGAAVSKDCLTGTALALQRGIVPSGERREQEQKQEGDPDRTKAAHAAILSCCRLNRNLG